MYYLVGNIYNFCKEEAQHPRLYHVASVVCSVLGHIYTHLQSLTELLSKKSWSVPGIFHCTSKKQKILSVKICTAQMPLSLTAHAVSMFSSALWLILWNTMLGFRHPLISWCMSSWWLCATCWRLECADKNTNAEVSHVKITKTFLTLTLTPKI